MSSFQQTKSTQTSGSVLAEKVEVFKKTKFELELMEIIDFFQDGYGSYDSNLVTFEI